MAIINKEQREYISDLIESMQVQIDELEEELEAALEDRDALKLQITRMMIDRSLAV